MIKSTGQDYATDKALDTLRRYVREHAMRNSAERELVLAACCSHRGLFTAEQLRGELNDPLRSEEGKQQRPVSRATVYNSLDLFCKIGLVWRHFMWESFYYECAVGDRCRLYMLCTNCGKMVTFRDKRLRELMVSKSFRNFRGSHSVACIYGLCEKCQKEENNNNPTIKWKK